MYVPLRIRLKPDTPITIYEVAGYVEIPEKPRTPDEYKHDVEVEVNLNGLYIYTSEYGHDEKLQVGKDSDVVWWDIVWTDSTIICPGEPHEGDTEIHSQEDYENCLWLRYAVMNGENPDAPRFRGDWDREYQVWNANRGG